MISSQPVARNNFRTFSVSLPALRVLCHQNAGTISKCIHNCAKTNTREHHSTLFWDISNS